MSMSLPAYRILQEPGQCQILAATGCAWRGTSDMASLGQAARQTPHPKQRLGSM
jgi:hypothetical protein